MRKDFFIGVWFKLLNCLLFPTLSLLMLKSISNIPMMQVFFAQVFLGAIISFFYLKIINKPVSLKMNRKDFILYLARAISNLGAIYLWIYALTNIGINEATALGYTGPLWVVIMARYILGEKYRGGVFLLLAVNIVGMVIILEPQYANIHWQGVFASLGAILLWSGYEVICKKQASDQHYMLQTFYFMSFSAIIILPFIFGSWPSVSSEEIWMLILVAMIAVANITVIFIAYSMAPLTLIAPFSYSRLIFTVILTSWIYHEVPSINVFIGAAVIIFANGYFAYWVKSKEVI